MKKTKTITQTYECCDLCERDCGNGFHNTCYFCHRKLCLTCCRWRDLATRECGRSDRRVLEFPIHVCHECEAAGKPLDCEERITAELIAANEKVVMLLNLWRKAATDAKASPVDP